ncbi:hypothetical protein HDU76_013069 [Blyttiomyces sp. JEL0837]|nr:hypothetical protein HDU76_013069 [Blyttiomyces sp. JEL0837]
MQYERTIRDLTPEELTPDMDFSPLLVSELKEFIIQLGGGMSAGPGEPLTVSGTKKELIAMLQDTITKRLRRYAPQPTSMNYPQSQTHYQYQEVPQHQQHQQTPDPSAPQSQVVNADPAPAPPPRVTSRPAVSGGLNTNTTPLSNNNNLPTPITAPAQTVIASVDNTFNNSPAPISPMPAHGNVDQLPGYSSHPNAGVNGMPAHPTSSPLPHQQQQPPPPPPVQLPIAPIPSGYSLTDPMMVSSAVPLPRTTSKMISDPSALGLGTATPKLKGKSLENANTNSPGSNHSSLPGLQPTPPMRNIPSVGGGYGNNEPSNKEPEIFRIYLAQAEIGDTYSQNQIGKAFLNGTGGVRMDNREAFEWFKRAADMGYAPAQVQVGIMLQDGLLLDGYVPSSNPVSAGGGASAGKNGVAGIPDMDLQMAADMYLRAAEQMDLDGMTKLGRCYMNGWGVRKDEKAAVAWYKLAARNGGARAQNQLGWCYWKGKGVEKDWAQAVYWYRQSAEQGHAEGQFNLGLSYNYGWAGPKDPIEAVNWFWRAAENGVAAAALELGNCIEKGVGVVKDPAKAVLWFRKSADLGYDRAQEKLGSCYQHGIGVEKNSVEAVKWFKLAADQGFLQAMGRLGLAYQKGEGVEKDVYQAAEWFKKGANLGCTTSQTNLATCYENGWGVPQDISKAIQLYTAAAKANNAQAQTNLGFCYERGIGVPQNLMEADRLYKAAASKDHPLAQSSLATFYENGIAGNPKDPVIAIRLYASAAKRGDASGQFKLGRCYELGIGADIDMPLAVKWYRKACNQRHDRAMANLGLILLEGRGVPSEPVEAIRLLHAAAELGNTRAMQQLSKCYETGIVVNMPVAAPANTTPGVPAPPPQMQMVALLERDPAKAKAWADRYKVAEKKAKAEAKHGGVAGVLGNSDREHLHQSMPSQPPQPPQPQAPPQKEPTSIFGMRLGRSKQ